MLGLAGRRPYVILECHTLYVDTWGVTEEEVKNFNLT